MKRYRRKKKYINFPAEESNEVVSAFVAKRVDGVKDLHRSILQSYRYYKATNKWEKEHRSVFTFQFEHRKDIFMTYDILLPEQQVVFIGNGPA